MNHRDLVLNVFWYDTRFNAEGVEKALDEHYGERMSRASIHVHLSNLAKAGELFRLKHGWYCLPDSAWTRNGRRIRRSEAAPNDVIEGTFVPSGRYDDGGEFFA